jgi:hypothetical protein
MRFEVLRQRVERAERRVEGNLERAREQRQVFGQAWRAGWSPARIVVAGLVSGFLIGRGQPLSRVGGARWLQMLGTVSSMLATLQAAAATEEAGQSAQAAAQQATAAAEAASDEPVAPAGQASQPLPAAEPLAPAPAEAATDVSER